MNSTGAHARIIPIPHGENSLSAARLDALRSQHTGLVVDFHELKITAPPRLFIVDGRIHEQIQGVYIPRRLRFNEVKILEGSTHVIDSLPHNHPGRTLTTSLHWRSPEGMNFHLMWLHDPTQPDLLFTARSCSAEERSGPSQETAFIRDWSPCPASPPRLVPRPVSLHKRFGGDPISVNLKEGLRHRRLFIGGLDIQPDQRPEVDVVLNLGELPSRWVGQMPLPACDRWTEKGEGALGMNVGDLRKEAAWVVDRLQAGQRVLVHCAAGMNRSGAICCAALVLLEGLTAEAALARVREHHPWAHLDSRHWLTLRWLAQNPLIKD